MSIFAAYLRDRADRTYLELGVENGYTNEFLAPKMKVVYGVDNNPKARHVTHCMTTDEFFARWPELGLPEMDVIYIDADHHFDQVLRDYRNSVSIISKRGIIFMHDLIPPSAQHIEQAACGDAWRFLFWALSEGCRWAPSIFSNVEDFGCTCFPLPQYPPMVVPNFVYTAVWTDMLPLLLPENRLKSHRFAELVRRL